MLSALTILGGGGWFPAQGRQTACALLRDGDSAILIDAGTGVGRLVEQPELLDGIEQLDILLTHFHLDHIAGLASTPAPGICAQPAAGCSRTRRGTRPPTLATSTSTPRRVRLRRSRQPLESNGCC